MSEIAQKELDASVTDATPAAQATLATLEETLERFFGAFLDETSYREYRNAERIIETLKAQGQTVSGVPRVRPSDCSRALAALEAVFEAYKPLFRTRDPGPIHRFEELISDFATFVEKLYPAEAIGVRILHADVHLIMGDPEGVEEAIGGLADRPYLIQGGFNDYRRVVEIRGKAMLMDGRIGARGTDYLVHGRRLIRNGRMKAIGIARAFAPFLAAADTPPAAEGVFAHLLVKSARRLVRARRPRRGLVPRVLTRLRRGTLALRMAVLFDLLSRFGDLRWRQPATAPTAPKAAEAGLSRRYLVTRAMGGIGDLLMMTPGLRALALKSGQPVDLAVPKGFFPVFLDNPHVRLIDINGAPLDTLSYRGWRNLTICPAGRYESRTRPHVRKGRVELFARGMGIRKRLLTRHGWNIQMELDADQRAARDAFLAERGIGKRPVVGVQPYSRDSYKDHPRIGELIVKLAEDHDVIVLHHLADGIPQGPGIWSTAGQSLATSLALVSRLDAMVSVDSAFLHAAAAFDVPVVALFGPTDGRTFTRHHKHATVLWKPEVYGCSPCWRNEDLPCILTGLTGISPCVNAIGIAEIQAEVTRLLDSHGRRSLAPSPAPTA